ncbi:Dyp-type peroxidase [Oscillatoria sp. HE19RPO]|uniref:Dyp-type peroxidase n=1 Tax=Oscillatoria sp. HE19RPO TaxID=2954806 RepID=UPI0020C53FA2|nr:Dyp-type peroxidase [Oscillatoria sp. HE19RPO]
MVVDLTQSNIDPNNPIYQPLLADLQGNILTSHDCDYSAHIFIQFKPNRNAVRQWIANFAKTRITSAQRQGETGGQFPQKNTGASPGLFANFLLSYKGYEALGFKFQVGGNREFPSPAFKVGLANFRSILDDPPVEDWQPGFQTQIHGFILLADDDWSQLNNQAKILFEELEPIADIVNTEVGRVLRNSKGQAIEHFGFRDGVSQPLFFKEDLDRAKQQGIDKWDPSAPLELVLVKDPLGEGEYSFGSYCVYRKLEQDVSGFKAAEKALFQTLKLSKKEEERAGALVVGRFRDGTPITQFPTEQNVDPVPNNFNYDEDLRGVKCPFHAHIRKVNPRGDKNDRHQTIEEQRQHRIVRRAISYGELPNARHHSLSPQVRFNNQLAHLQNLTRYPGEDEKVGLLFLCFQSDLFNQFMFMQKNWSNNHHFVTYTTGFDALVGQGKPKTSRQKWHNQWGENEVTEFDFYHFVTMQGGEYFFAPSISFLKTIASNFRE